MKTIYLTGDTHGTWFNIMRIKNVPNCIHIVLGDFGFIWGAETESNLFKLERDLNKNNNLLLFIDGNHENFEKLNQYPVEEWNGGLVHRITNHILHLMRGQVFEIEGKKFFTMGGADSIDKGRRTNRVSWWEEENITSSDINTALNNLEKHDFKVDYVLTHTCPQDIKELLGYKLDYDNYNENILSDIRNLIEFKHWYFGHMHGDDTIGQYTCLYHKVEKLSERSEDGIN